LELSTEEEVVASMHIDVIRYHLICFCLFIIFVYSLFIFWSFLKLLIYRWITKS